MIAFILSALVFLLLLSVPVGVVMGLLGIASDMLFSPVPLIKVMGQIAWNSSQKFELLGVPLFVLMGELFLRSGIAGEMYACLRQWLSWLPGGLMHSNIGACGLFAATSGSSVATAASIGTLALPQQEQHGYNQRLFLGSLAAGGTLGILVPPSVNMIVFGVMTNTSIPQLYMAGMIPGLLLMILFMGTVAACCMAVPAWGGRPIKTSWPERWRALRFLAPPLGLFVVVVGSIYAGYATPTEAAAIGVVATLAMTAIRRKLTLKTLREAVEGALRTTTMVLFIVIGAFFLNFVMVTTGTMARITGFVENSGLAPHYLMLFIMLMYLVLGCFMDALAMVITTIPVVTPVVVSLGYDPVWFGIMIVLFTETSLITPPVGINLYVLQGIRHGGPIIDVIIGTLPFVLTLLVMIGVLFAYPDLALYLPTLFYR